MFQSGLLARICGRGSGGSRMVEAEQLARRDDGDGDGVVRSGHGHRAAGSNPFGRDGIGGLLQDVTGGIGWPA